MKGRARCPQLAALGLKPRLAEDSELHSHSDKPDLSPHERRPTQKKLGLLTEV